MEDIVWADVDERDLINGMLADLGNYEVSNAKKESYYLGRKNITNLGMDIPSRFAKMGLVMGWPGTTVDVLEERLDWLGWTSDTGEDYGLSEVYAANGLDVDASMAHLDALIYGTSFVVVGAGADGEPNPLITMESARNMTGIYDTRTRRLSVAIGVNDRDKNGKPVEVTLYLKDRNLVLGRPENSDDWYLIDENVHNVGRVLVVQLVNRSRASDQKGKSEITRTIRSLTDQAVRTMYAMEINREFYAFPQTAFMGLTEGDADDLAAMDKFTTAMTKVWGFEADENGKVPTIERFTPASPQPFISQLETLSQSLAAEAGMPPSYLGYQTDNPASADAIRQMESRLVKRAERRQSQFGRAWKEVGYLAVLVRDGEVPEEFGSTVNVKWRDASTPTRAAAADEVTKLTGAGVLPPDSTVVMDRIGLSPQEQKTVESERRRGTSNQRLSDLAAALANDEEEPVVTETGE